MEERDTENPLWIDTERLLQAHRGMGPRAVGIQMTLVFICCEQGFAMTYDAQAFADAVNSTKKGVGKEQMVTAAEIEELKPLLRRFFVETSDGKWALSPEIFVINNPYEEGAGN